MKKPCLFNNDNNDMQKCTDTAKEKERKMIKKNIFRLLILTVMLVFSANAFAFDYSQTLTFSPVTLMAGSELTLDFSPPANSYYFTDASLLLVLGNVTHVYSGATLKRKSATALWLEPDVLTIVNFQTDQLYTFTFDTDSLGLLNAAVKESQLSAQPLSFVLQQTAGTATFKSATLAGPVAPEPVSMLLVAAGLAGLPFAGRLRKRIG